MPQFYIYVWHCVASSLASLELVLYIRTRAPRSYNVALSVVLNPSTTEFVKWSPCRGRGLCIWLLAWEGRSARRKSNQPSNSTYTRQHQSTTRVFYSLYVLSLIHCIQKYVCQVREIPWPSRRRSQIEGIQLCWCGILIASFSISTACLQQDSNTS
jgi:hypothetical protein